MRQGYERRRPKGVSLYAPVSSVPGTGVAQVVAQTRMPLESDNCDH